MTEIKLFYKCIAMGCGRGQ